MGCGCGPPVIGSAGALIMGFLILAYIFDPVLSPTPAASSESSGYVPAPAQSDSEKHFKAGSVYGIIQKGKTLRGKFIQRGSGTYEMIMTR